MKVLLFGTFDLLHPGHRFLLAEASKRGQVVVVVARDATVEHIKGRPPVDDEHVRSQNVREAVPSAEVILGDAADFRVPLRTVQPDLIILGYDQHLPPGVMEEDLSCPVERLPAFEPERYKSSLLRDKRTEN